MTIANYRERKTATVQIKVFNVQLLLSLVNLAGRLLPLLQLLANPAVVIVPLVIQAHHQIVRSMCVAIRVLTPALPAITGRRIKSYKPGNPLAQLTVV